LQKGHGVAFGDLRNNGQEDIFEVVGGAFPGDTYQSALFANPGHANHWVTLQLEGVKSNRAAFGARISVKLQTTRGRRRIYRTVGYGSSFGQNPFRQHIGVGEAEEIAEIEVAWPTSKSIQRFSQVAVDTAYRIREGDSLLQPLHLPQFSFPSGSSTHTMR
jgi:hypothetical protein